MINEYDNLNVGASGTWIAEKDSITNTHLGLLNTFKASVDAYIDDVDAYIVSLDDFSSENGAILESA